MERQHPRLKNNYMEEEKSIEQFPKGENQENPLKYKVCLKTYKPITDEEIVLGVSLLGRNHSENKTACQDFHVFSDIGDGWHVYLVADGAGSACASDRGSRWNCIFTEHLIKGLLNRNDWKFRNKLPSELEWYQEFYAICRQVKYLIEERVDSIDEPRLPKDFNATLLVLIVTPMGMLTGHIGDGRMGYQDKQGNWHSLMVPHKGEEINQTIFVMNKWDRISIPNKKMNGVSVPEVRVIEDIPTTVVVLSDGCENFSWQCLQKNEETGRFEDLNLPFADFWNPCITTVMETNTEERFEKFATFIDQNTDECKQEQDDRTVIMGIYHNYAERENTPN